MADALDGLKELMEKPKELHAVLHFSQGEEDWDLAERILEIKGLSGKSYRIICCTLMRAGLKAYDLGNGKKEEEVVAVPLSSTKAKLLIPRKKIE